MPSKIVFLSGDELWAKPEPLVLVESLKNWEWTVFEQLNGRMTVIPPSGVAYIEQVPPDSGG